MSAPQLPVHPVANIFPMMSDAELADLAADIAEHGQREPVWLYGGRIVDGRNRAAACARLGRQPNTREFLGADDELVPFVVSLNLKRRHLTEGQRSAVAANIANLSNGQRASSANLQSTPVTQAGAAELMNVSPRSVASAVKVKNEAPAEVFQAVQAGALSVSLAAEVADLPRETQEVIAAAPPEQMREIAREEVRRAHVANNSGNNEWYTPPEYIRRAREVMGGIDLDPASSEIANRTVGATRFFTAEDDGLSKPWSGRVWMNPPYAQPLIAQFCEKLAEEVGAQNVKQAVVLVNNGTETQWFQTLLRYATAVCFPQGRVRFLHPDGKPSGAPLQGQAVLYFGAETQAFAAVFNSLGRVAWTVSEFEIAEAHGEF
jgi:ParB family chromosome partitioning protein